jgi:hypothetical protein
VAQVKKLLLASMLLLPQAVQAEPVECVKAVALYAPKRGVIATGTIAKNIANIYLGEVYGAQKILAEFPLTAKLQDGVWTVEAIFRLLRMVAWQSYGSVAATEQS